MGTTLGVSVMMFVGLWFTLACVFSAALIGVLMAVSWSVDVGWRQLKRVLKTQRMV